MSECELRLDRIVARSCNLPLWALDQMEAVCRDMRQWVFLLLYLLHVFAYVHDTVSYYRATNQWLDGWMDRDDASYFYPIEFQLLPISFIILRALPNRRD